MQQFKCIICESSEDFLTVSETVHGDRSGTLKAVDCVRCGHRQLHPPSYELKYYKEDGQVESVINYYGTKFETLIDHAWIDATRRVQRFFEKGIISKTSSKECPGFGVDKPLKVLDVGGGYGFFGVEFENALPSSTVLTIDPSLKRIEIGKREISKKYPEFQPKFLACLLDDEFAEKHNSEFDIVVAWHVLEHLEDPVGFIHLAEKVLKSGGVLCLEVPNSNDDLLGLSKGYRDRFFMTEHLSYFTPARLSSMLSNTKNKGKVQVAGHQRYGIYNYTNWIKTNEKMGENPDLFDGNERFWLESVWLKAKEATMTTDAIFAWKWMY